MLLGFLGFTLLVIFRSHEEMSIKMVDYIVDEHHIDVDSEMIKKVKVRSFL